MAEGGCREDRGLQGSSWKVEWIMESGVWSLEIAGAGGVSESLDSVGNQEWSLDWSTKLTGAHVVYRIPH